MAEIIDKEYYEENPEYSEVECIKCKTKTLKCIGIMSSEDMDTPDKTLYKCDTLDNKLISILNGYFESLFKG